MPAPDSKPLLDLLWSTDTDPSGALWAALDGARDNSIYLTALRWRLDQVCLYSGDLPPELRPVAPYLVRLERTDDLSLQLLRLGWGNSWGIFLRSKEPPDRLRRHLRQFLVVQDERKRRMLFRYYDPRVLRVFLPTCTTSELRTLFGPVDAYVIEGETGETVIEYGFDGVRLSAREAPISGTNIRGPDDRVQRADATGG